MQYSSGAAELDQIGRLESSSRVDLGSFRILTGKPQYFSNGLARFPPPLDRRFLIDGHMSVFCVQAP